jgi:ATP-binding cassette subfamily G (WHITE) protein 2
MRLTMNRDIKALRVDQLIRDMNLSRCKDTYIGNAMIKGISGGERKRTCIAVELIADPPVLILDGKYKYFIK